MEDNTNEKKQSKHPLWDGWAANRAAERELEELAKKGELFKK